MKVLKKQQGFGMLASMSIILGIAIVGSIWVAEASTKRRILNNSESFYHRIIYLQTQIHAFVNDSYLEGHRINGAAIFPNRLAALEPKYIPTCSDADNQNGFCMKVNQTPWGMIEESDYRVVAIPNTDGSGVSHYRAEFDVKLPDKDSVALKYERQATLAMLAQVPNIFYDDTANILTVRIDRPDKAFAYESLVKRSGDDSTLLGDWDVGGNFAITNVRDITFRNADGSQKGVSSRLTDIYTVPHGTWIQKPKCSQGADVVSSFSITEVRTDRYHTLTGMQRAYKLDENSTHIQVGLDVSAKKNSNGANVALHLGLVTITLQCK